MAGLSPQISGLVGGLAAVFLLRLARRMKPIEPGGDGWAVLRPGWLLNGLFGACVIFVTICVIALVNIKSRADWREQVTPLILLILGFGAGAIYTGWIAYSRVIKFNDNEIVIRRRFGQTTVWPRSAVHSAAINALTGDLVLTFADGRKLRVCTIMKGANELARQLQGKPSSRT